jgi:3-deoxy-D-manno-octulosonic-acid transferase
MFESGEQIARVQEVLPKNAQVIATGNLKFSFPVIAAPPNSLQLEKWIKDLAGDRPVLAAGSTGDADENWILEVWPQISKTGAVLMLAPRNIKRAEEIEKRFQNAGFRVARRSQPHHPEEQPDLLLLDTLGELAFAYKWAKTAYVGGAVTGRGHNILEPLAWGVPVAYGPMRGDFENAQKLAEEFEVGFRLQSSQELAAFWAKWQNKESHAPFQSKARALFDSQEGALERVVGPIISLIQNSCPRVNAETSGAINDNSHHQSYRS